MARRDSVGTRLITRRGNGSRPQPLRVALRYLRVRSRLIDGRMVWLRRAGARHVPVATPPRERAAAFLYAFDLLELNGDDLRREPIEVRKATLASILRKSRHGGRLNEDLEHNDGEAVFPPRLQDGAGGDCLEAARLTLPIWAFSRLVEVQEPRGAGGEA